MDKLLLNLFKKKKERAQIYKIRNKGEVTTDTDTIEIQRIM